MGVRSDADGEDFTRTLTLGVQANLTVCGWFRLVVDRDTWSTVFSVDNGTGDNWLMQTGNDGVTMNSVFDATTQQSMGAMTVGTWYFICLTTAGTTGNIFYRTAAQSALTTVAVSGATASVNAATLRIGESPWGTEWWNGDCANVCMWLANLTAAEVLQESTRYVPYRFANLAAWYPLTRPGDTADYSGNGRTLSGGAGTTYVDGPPIPWYTSSRPRIILPASGGGGSPINVTLDRATETSVGRLLVPSKNALLARATESDVGRVLARHKAVLLPRSTEADSGRTLTPSKSAALMRATETDSGRLLSASKTVPLSRSTESSTARNLVRSKTVALGKATESDTGRLLSRSKTINFVRATETDTARTLSRSKIINFTRAVEVSSARTLSKHTLWILERATETESARSLSVAKRVTLSRAAELDIARVVGVGQPIIVTLGRAVEVDTARAFGASKIVVLGRATEVDIGRGLALQKIVALARALELDIAQSLELGGDIVRPIVDGGEDVVLVDVALGSPVRLLQASSGLTVVMLTSGPGEYV